jgi:hypothetical protein
MPTPDRLLELTTPAVRHAARAYLKSRDAAAFERAMQQALAKAHTAAVIRGTIDRTVSSGKAYPGQNAMTSKPSWQVSSTFSKALCRHCPI